MLSRASRLPLRTGPTGATGFTTADVIDSLTVTNAATSAGAELVSFSLGGDSRLQSIVASTVVEIRLYHYGTSNRFESNALSSGNGRPGLDLNGTVVIPESGSAALACSTC